MKDISSHRDNVKKRELEEQNVENDKRRRLEEELEENSEDTEERTNQFNFYQKAKKEFDECTIEIRKNADLKIPVTDKTFLKSIMALLRIKKYDLNNDQPSLTKEDVGNTSIAWLETFPAHQHQLLSFCKSLLTNSHYYNDLRSKALPHGPDNEQLKEASKNFKGPLLKDLIWDEHTESILTPLTSLLLLPFNETSAPFINNLVQILPQEYVDFTDLDGDTAATLSISLSILPERDDIAEIIVNKTSVNSLFSPNSIGENAIYRACQHKKDNLVKIIIEKYNNDLLDEEQKSIWTHSDNLYDVLHYLIDKIIEKKEDFKLFEKAIINAFECVSNTTLLKENFASYEEYEEKLDELAENKEKFSNIINSFQGEEFTNNDHHHDQIN
jgi:hypothetical protein